MTDGSERESLIQRAVSGAMDATVGRVEDRMAATARAIVDDLEPHLAEETIPNIVDALMPQLIESVVPDIVDGITAHLAATTTPQVLAAATPQLTDELIPVILERLRPYLEQQLIPAIVDGVTPHIVEKTVPRIITESMPLIRAEVVPAVLDDIVDDPRVRDLIREQSLGLVWDALESFRRMMARGDDLVERVVRRLTFRKGVVTDVAAAGPMPRGRSRSHAGILTRTVALVIDLSMVSFVATQGLAAVISVLNAVVDPIPGAVVATLTFFVATLAPLYFTLCWRFGGQTLGDAVSGFAVRRDDGSELRFGRSLARALLALILMPLWIVGMYGTVADGARRSWLDRLLGTRTPYRPHQDAQTRRHANARAHNLA